MTRILITGVRGKTGAPLAERLSRRDDVDVLGGSSDPSTVTIDGIRPTAFSWDDPSGWPRRLMASTPCTSCAPIVRTPPS